MEKLNYKKGLTYLLEGISEPAAGIASECPPLNDKSNTAAQLGLGSMGWYGVIMGPVLGVTLLDFIDS